MNRPNSKSAAEKWPALPAKPDKWTRKMVMHLNFGGDGGAGTFTVHDPDGMQMPFGYQYDTTKGGLTGFSLPGTDGVLTWKELVAAWPEFIKPKDKPKDKKQERDDS